MNVNTFFSGNNFTAGISHSYQRVIVRVDREDKFRINSGSLVSKLPIEIEILISSALSIVQFKSCPSQHSNRYVIFAEQKE